MPKVCKSTAPNGRCSSPVYVSVAIDHWDLLSSLGSNSSGGGSLNGKGMKNSSRPLGGGGSEVIVLK